jgi:HEAT repeat protein
LDDEKLSHMARYGLEPIPDPTVDDALRDALDKLKGRPLVGVIGSLGVRRDAQAVAPLTALLKGPDATAAQAAARALGKIGTPDAGQALQAALPKAPEDRRLAVAEGCLICAEALLAQGKLTEAAAMHKNVREAELPKHFRVAAVQGMILVQQAAEAP